MGGGVQQPVGDGAGSRGTPRVVEQVEGAALGDPQLQEDPFETAVRCGEDLPGVRRGAARGQAGRVGSGVFDVPPPHPADVAVRTGADPPPVAAGPVQQVVRAARGRVGCPVRHLVPLQSRGGEQFVGHDVAVGQHVVVERGQLAAAHPGGEPGAFFHDERVGGDVVRAGRDRGGEGLFPVGVALPGGPVDEVQVDVREPGLAGPGHALFGPSRGVGAFQDREHVRFGALHPEGDPGEPCFAQPGEDARVHGFRVGFGGDLGVGGEPELRVDRVEDAAEFLRGEQGGGAAAHEDGTHREFAVAEHPPGERYFSDRLVRVGARGGDCCRPAAAPRRCRC